MIFPSAIRRLPNRMQPAKGC